MFSEIDFDLLTEVMIGGLYVASPQLSWRSVDSL